MVWILDGMRGCVGCESMPVGVCIVLEGMSNGVLGYIIGEWWDE